MEHAPILLVEDNPDDAAFTTLAFERTAFTNEIIVAQDGSKALSYLLPEGNESPLRPAIVMLDINMPKMGGLEVLRVLRSNPATSLLPIIMLTTSNLSDDISASYRLGANSYICKSLIFDEFQEAVTALANYWLRINQRAAEFRPAESGPAD